MEKKWVKVLALSVFLLYACEAKQQSGQKK